ncbi:unnamed protein product, partial [Meganyctiphanes norvegica]
METERKKSRTSCPPMSTTFAYASQIGFSHYPDWSKVNTTRLNLATFGARLAKPSLSSLKHSVVPWTSLIEVVAVTFLCKAGHSNRDKIVLELLSPPLSTMFAYASQIGYLTVRVTSLAEEDDYRVRILNIIGPVTDGPTINTNNNTVLPKKSAGFFFCNEFPCSSDRYEGPYSNKMIYVALPYTGDKSVLTNIYYIILMRVHKIPPKEHFRLFVRANAIRPRSSSTTPWMVKEDLVKQYHIPSKLPSIFNMKPQPQKRKAEEPLVREIIKKPKEEIDPQQTVEKPGPKPGSKHSPKKVDESGDPKILKKRGPKPGSKRTPKMDLSSYFKKAEDGTVTKVENGPVPGMSPAIKVEGEVAGKKRGRPKMKQSSLFDVKTPNKKTVGANKSQSSPKKSPTKKKLMTPEGIMNLPLMRKLVYEHKHLKGVKGSGRKLVYTMDLAIKKLNREQIMMIPDESLREDLLARQSKVIEQKILADMSPEDKEEYLKQKAKDESERRRLAKNLENMKVEDINLNDLKPLPQPKMVPTPEVIPNSLFGDIVMVTEFLQCYRELLMPDDDINLSTSQLMEALAAGPNGFKATADIFCILLRTIIRDETSKNIKEQYLKIAYFAFLYWERGGCRGLCVKGKDLRQWSTSVADDALCAD